MKAQANGITRYFNGKSGDVIKMKTPKVKTYWRLTSMQIPVENERNFVNIFLSISFNICF